MSKPHALKPVDVLQVRALKKAGWTGDRLGRMYGVKAGTIFEAIGQKKAYHPQSSVMVRVAALEREYLKMHRSMRPWWAPDSPRRVPAPPRM